MRLPALRLTIVGAFMALTACSDERGDKAMGAEADHLSELRSWRHSSDVCVESLASLRALYFANALENLRESYDGSPLEAIVFEINQNNSVSVWVETTRSREGIVSRFRKGSVGYEDKTDSQVMESITPWYYEAFNYACLEATCTGDFKKLAGADSEFCESNFGDVDDGGLFAVSRDATIDAILKLEESQVLDYFDKSSRFEVRIFSNENDTISPGEDCWATNKLLSERRESKQSQPD